ncbi:MAG: efflux RND transporter periplasmic adaptor subunit [Prolixibacteraceae bacterium]
MKQENLLPVAVAVLVIITLFLMAGKKAGWLENDFQVSIAAETVESKTITDFITANGKIQPVSEVKIIPDVSDISALNVKKGEHVVGTSRFPDTEMMVITDPDKMEVQVELSEYDVVKVALNDTALIEVDSYLQRKFKGVVTAIANSARTEETVTGQMVNFDVKIYLLRESYDDLIGSAAGNFYPFRPGMQATVDIITEIREHVISVPVGAVTTRMENEEAGEGSIGSETDLLQHKKWKEVVFVYSGGRVKQVEVETGIQNNARIQILKGLNAGDEVIVAPYNIINKKLKNNMKAKAVSKEELFSASATEQSRFLIPSKSKIYHWLLSREIFSSF